MFRFRRFLPPLAKRAKSILPKFLFELGVISLTQRLFLLFLIQNFIPA